MASAVITIKNSTDKRMEIFFALAVWLTRNDNFFKKIWEWKFPKMNPMKISKIPNIMITSWRYPINIGFPRSTSLKNPKSSNPIPNRYKYFFFFIDQYLDINNSVVRLRRYQCVFKPFEYLARKGISPALFHITNYTAIKKPSCFQSWILGNIPGQQLP